MSDVEEEATSYEANTVEELREELRARDLPVSGHKDELIARLEEDDAAQAGETAADDKEVEAQEPTPEDYYPPRVYSPFELPANTAAAQAFIDLHPENVDESLELPPELQELAVANIQEHVDEMAAAGVVVEDSRLEGATKPAEADTVTEEEA